MNVKCHCLSLMAFASCLAEAVEMEEVRAKEACMIVVDRLNIHPKLCEHDVRTQSFWLCIDERMDEGEGFAFASERCKNIIKHHGASREHGDRE